METSQVNVTAAQPQLITVGALLTEGWHLMCSKIGFSAVIFGATILYSIVSIAGVSLVITVVYQNSMNLVQAGIIGLLGLLLFVYGLSAVCVAYTKGFLAGNVPTPFMAQLQSSWKYTLSFMAIMLYSVIVMNIGFSLFIIPGIIAFVYFNFVSFALVGEGHGGILTFARSAHLVSGNFWGVLGRLVALMALGFLVLIGASVILSVILSTGTAESIIAGLLFILVCIGVSMWYFSCRVVLFRSLQSLRGVETFHPSAHQGVIWLLRVIVGLAVLGIIVLLSVVIIGASSFLGGGMDRGFERTMHDGYAPVTIPGI